VDGIHRQQLSNNILSTQTGDIIDNPENPVNPDSKPSASG